MAEMIYTALTDSLRGPSRPIWKDFDIPYLLNNPSAGVVSDGNYPSTFPGAALAASGATGPYYGFLSAGASFAGAAKFGGGVTIATAATDNLAAGIQRRSPAFRLSSADGKLVYEASVTIPAVDATNPGGILFGLMNSTAISATYPIVTAGTLATTLDFIGFWRPESSTGVIGCYYQATGQSPVTVKATALTAVAGTTYKLGFVFDPAADPSSRIVFTNNGAPISGATVSAANAALATFPSTVWMNNATSCLTNGATVTTYTVNWDRCAQKAV